jgi:gamma-glutamylcyclotransferase (GGCT)/AIG2-like uncharacterized protein YtfP
MFYFAYGANLNIRNMSVRCPNAKPIVPITLNDMQLVFRGVADIEHKQGAILHGAIWDITDECEASLDIFEGYPSLYRKEYFTVKLSDQLAKDFGDTADVLVYRMNRDGYSPPSHMYYETIRQGYRDFNLDPTNLIQARDSFPNHMHKQDIWRSKQWG